MADTYTTSNRFEKMEPGQYLDTWGARWNAQGGSDLIDASLDGVESFALSGSKTLTNNNGSSDEARKRILNISGGSGGTITIPNVTKVYVVRNASSGTVTFTTGSGTTAQLLTGQSGLIISVGSNVVYALITTHFGSSAITGGSFLASSTGGVGYATGAGDTTTQTTNRDTGVTINKTCGKITTHDASLASQGVATFTVTNSTVAATDTIVLTMVSNGGSSAYAVEYTVYTIAGGSFGITYRNLTGGALAQPFVFNFAVIKGATS